MMGLKSLLRNIIKLFFNDINEPMTFELHIYIYI